MLELFDRVKTKNMDGKYNDVAGTIIEINGYMDYHQVYTVKYDVPFGSITKGMYKACDLIKIE